MELKYKVPIWNPKKPLYDYKFEVVKNGVQIGVININEKGYYLIGERFLNFYHMITTPKDAFLAASLMKRAGRLPPPACDIDLEHPVRSAVLILLLLLL